MKSTNKNHTPFFVGGVVVVLVLLNLISLRGFFRMDLTRDKKYTLSKASIETVHGLKDVLTVSAYFTEGLPPPYAQHSRYVHDLLEEYLAASSGNFAFEFTDPTHSETAEDKAKKKEIQRDIFGRMVRESTSVERDLAELGLKPVEIRVFEDDQQQTKRAYMGLVIRYQDKHEVIPVVQNLADLEKDLTTLMRKLTRAREPKVGLIRDLSSPSIERAIQLWKRGVAVEPIDLSKEGDIAADLDALLVVGSGEHFGDSGAQKIQKFLSQGKSVAFFLDKFRIDPRSFQGELVNAQGKTQKVFDLLKGYGIDITDSLVADVACASFNVQEERGGFAFSLPLKYPFVPELSNLSFESPITKGLSGVLLPFVANIEVAPKAGLTIDVLGKSSKVSWLEKDPLDLNPRRNWNEAKIVPDGPHILMVQARGSLEEPATGQAEKPAESRLVVIGTSAFIWDDFLSGANQMLASNIVDFMLEDPALLEMRSRTFSDAPLDSEISDTKRQAIKLGNILGVPLLLVVYGLIRWRRREARRHSLAAK